MTVWYNPFFIRNRHRALRIAGLLFVFAALITTVLIALTAQAAPNTTKTVNFQGRLTAATGAVVPDGYYNMQFKLYEDGAGTAAGNPGGTLRWTESYVNNGGTEGVQVRNGYFTVNLGSATPFGTSVDWDKDTLWLSMNVAGSNIACSSFGTSPCVADGEMLPMSRITATPYSINSGAVGGKTANELVQLGQGTQTDASNNSSIDINKTGTGNLIELQASGKDSFTVNNAGSIELGSVADQSITVAQADAGAGKSLTIEAGAAADGSQSAGGDLLLQGGTGDGAGSTGNVIVKANGSDSSGTFQVQDTDGKSVLTVDTENKVVSTGTLSLASSAAKGATDTVSLWGGGPVTGTAYVDGTPTTLGTAFKSSVAGSVTGIRFYNPDGGNSGGGNTGQLWACNDATCSPGGDGSVIASVSFAVDTSEGWKTATFPSPIPIAANTYYVATYKTSNGVYYATSHYFDAEYTNGVMSAPSGDSIRNGRYNDQNDGLLPTKSFNNTNYWVDVNFQADVDVDQIHSANELIISSESNMTVGPVSSSLRLQGSAIDISARNGGNVTMQGGNATINNGNGGSIHLSGGAGTGTGASGLVVMTTPTFATASSDSNCYTGGATVAASCTISQASVDNFSTINVGFSASDQTATLPDPTNKTSGRIMYIMAAGESSDFTLATTGSTSIIMSANTAATLLWNGSTWISASGTTTANLLGSKFAPQMTAESTTSFDTELSGDSLSTTDPTAPAVDESAATAGTEPISETPLLKASKADSPILGDPSDLLGSMYYDTTLGKLQCYEASGWGPCDASPDTFVTLSPEYANAVTHGTGIGKLSSDLCSDALNINNGSGSQAAVCGVNETYNFYNWTSPEATKQTRSFFITYQLPASFKEFVPNLTSVTGRTDGTDATVTYQIYRNDKTASLTPCGALTTVSSGAKSTWQKATSTGQSDPSSCTFAAGDSIVIRANLEAAKDANAYISNIGFVFSNH